MPEVFEALSGDDNPHSHNTPAGHLSSETKTASAQSEAAEPNPSEENTHQSNILVEKEGDRIKTIRVLCSCGQSTVLECDY